MYACIYPCTHTHTKVLSYLFWGKRRLKSVKVLVQLDFLQVVVGCFDYISPMYPYTSSINYFNAGYLHVSTKYSVFFMSVEE